MWNSMVLGEMQHILVHLQHGQRCVETADKNKHSFCKHTATLPDLEAWITDHRSKGISMSTKRTIFEVRQWVVPHGIFVGTPHSHWTKIDYFTSYQTVYFADGDIIYLELVT